MNPVRPPRVVFDFGAVLFRWRPAHVVRTVWPHRARTEAELAQTVADCFQAYGGDWGAFDQGLIDEQVLAERMQARMGWPVAEVLALVAAIDAELQVQPGVLALLLELKAAGHRLSYLSNMPTVLSRGLLARNPLPTWFESGVFSCDVRLIKPDPALFALAAQSFGEQPTDCLLIDDHPANIEAAHAGGWQAELFTTPALLAEALNARGLLGASGR